MSDKKETEHIENQRKQQEIHSGEFSENELKLLNLIAEIIVEISIKEYYEKKGN